MKEEAPDGGCTPPSAYHDHTFYGGMTMDRPDDTSKSHSGNNQHAAAAPSTALPTHAQQRIEAQRAQVLQAHGVLRCLHTVLLHAECDDAVFYADTA
ncbi:MAG TPA: hypothetical protein VFO36_04165, partial [Nitrospiraceae bacterium]|nr:hypothetical protein [Nitrospiraceae bacterium]